MRGLVLGLAISLLGAQAGAATIGTGAGQYGEGSSFALSFNGLIEGHDVAGLSAQMTFTVADIDTSANTIVLNYSISNTSSAPIDYSRISAFGFNTDPNLLRSSDVTGVFTREHYERNVPQLGTFEFCANQNLGYSCGGGMGVGVRMGETGDGTLTLRFANSIADGAELTDFFVRYQSVWGSRYGTSGVGIATPPIPEPGAVALFGLGALLIGLTLRRRSA